jgi:hypothetical protein
VEALRVPAVALRIAAATKKLAMERLILDISL